MKLLYISDLDDYFVFALTQDGALIKLRAAKKNAPNLAGNIYLARAEAIYKTGSVFFNIGAGKNAYLKNTGVSANKTVKTGQILPVLVLRDETAQKGSLVTTKLSAKNAYFVISRGKTENGVSAKIKPAAKRAFLHTFLKNNLPGGFSGLARTKSENLSESELLARFLPLLTDFAQALKDLEKAAKKTPPCLVYGDECPITKETEGFFEYAPDISEIITDLKNGAVSALSAKFGAALNVVKTGSDGFFAAYNLTKQINSGLCKKVWLKCGGYIIIEHTEACVAIDINSGRCVNVKNREKSIKTVNEEAAREIAAQIILRGLAGKIVIDFINPKNSGEFKAYAETLNALLIEHGLSNTEILPLAGIVVLIIRKTRESVDKLLSLDR